MSSGTIEEIDEFLGSTAFSGYQAVPLPHGRRVPGRDRSAVADVVFRRGVSRKSVLDVGTYYGFLPYEAVTRGASRAVGLEPDPERFAIADRISQLNGGYEIVNSSIEELKRTERFDVVCILNVLHHVSDPVAVLRMLCELCSETLVVEFCLPDDPDYIQHVIAGKGCVGIAARTRAKLRSFLLRLASGELPVMAVGNRSYHRVFYFSPAAFRNLMTTHLQLVEEIEFVHSPDGGRRVVAICAVAS